jgi:maltose O-acetyltransferase
MRSLLSALAARARGQQTLARLSRAGLQAGRPLQLGAEGAIDPRFAWAIEIGPESIVASGVRIVAHDAAVKRLTGYTEVRPVKIGSRCYIGAGTIVLPGSTIGDEAIVGAGSVVRGEIPAGAVAAGCPARVVGEIGDLRERHLEQMAATLQIDDYPRRFSRAQRAEMRDALSRHGRVYVR